MDEITALPTEENAVNENETSEPITEEVPTPAQVVAHEILNELQQSIEVPEENTEEEEVEESEPSPQIDYSQQLSDINISLDDLSNTVSTNLQSVIDRQDSIQNEIMLVKEQHEEYMLFFYVTNSLYVGLFVAILFFKGLKK